MSSNIENINIKLDNEKKSFLINTYPLEIMEKFEIEDNRDIIGITVNNTIYDLQTPVKESGEIKVIKLSEDSKEARTIYRHSFSHIMAHAVLRLYPESKLAIGPATEEGFYYDFDLSHSFSPEDLKNISKEMKKIIKENHKFMRKELTVEEAKERFSKNNQSYKLELIKDIEERGENVTIYEDGDFIDLCRGPHLRSTSQVKNFKLLDLAGAYWKGDEKNNMLQRIYGTSFFNKQDLKDYIWMIEEAKKRDHRKLGKDLDLFSILPEEVGSGLVLWHPKGGLIRHLIEEHCKKRHLENGYEFVVTPHIGRSTLWETSGHLDFYKESMFPEMEMEGQSFYMKPMNCPFHTHIFKNKIRSYRNLPMRFAEWGTVYRFERSGAVHGLTRVRGFTQDDAHLFCRPDQMKEEIDKVLDFSISILKDFGLTKLKLYLSTRPEKRVGDDKDWDSAEEALKNALEKSNLPFEINEGDGAFYGPKIDICVFDAIKREWQLSTIQFDFNLPERFNLSFIGEDGAEHRPFMIHRALLGSMERFFGILIEHYGGAFPFWLSPIQVSVLPIGEKHVQYAKEILEELLSLEIRADIDNSSNTLSYRVRQAQMQKIPYVFIIGDKEMESKKVSVRKRGGEDLGVIKVKEFLSRIN